MVFIFLFLFPLTDKTYTGGATWLMWSPPLQNEVPATLRNLPHHVSNGQRFPNPAVWRWFRLFGPRFAGDICTEIWRNRKTGTVRLMRSSIRKTRFLLVFETSLIMWDSLISYKHHFELRLNTSRIIVVNFHWISYVVGFRCKFTLTTKLHLSESAPVA